MKRYLLLIVSMMLFFSGCGVTWFPDNKAATGAAPSVSVLAIPSSVNIGTSSSLTFTIVNGTGNPAQSGLGFTDTLPTDVTVVSPLSAQTTCGGTATGSGSTITFSGGALAANATSCTVSVQVTSTKKGSYSFLSTGITGLAGGLLNGATTQTLTVTDTASVASGNGRVTAANATPNAPTSNGDLTSDISIDVDLSNSDTTSGAIALVAVTVQAVDTNGSPIPSTLSSTTIFPGNFEFDINANTVSQLFSGTVPGIPDTDIAKIHYWHIISVVLR